MADHSEFGWATIKHYEANQLTSDLDDKKLIKKAGKEAQKEAEKRIVKLRQGTSNTAAKYRWTVWSDQPRPRYCAPYATFVVGTDPEQAQSAGTLLPV